MYCTFCLSQVLLLAHFPTHHTTPPRGTWSRVRSAVNIHEEVSTVPTILSISTPPSFEDRRKDDDATFSHQNWRRDDDPILLVIARALSSLSLLHSSIITFLVGVILKTLLFVFFLSRALCWHSSCCLAFPISLLSCSLLCVTYYMRVTSLLAVFFLLVQQPLAISASSSSSNNSAAAAASSTFSDLSRLSSGGATTSTTTATQTLQRAAPQNL